jgi:hypothetical protein
MNLVMVVIKEETGISDTKFEHIEMVDLYAFRKFSKFQSEFQIQIESSVNGVSSVDSMKY